jgi:secreted trypsin-like serine protease
MKLSLSITVLLALAIGGGVNAALRGRYEEFEYDHRIVGGVPSLPGEFPSYAIPQGLSTQNSGGLCGATLIHSDILLSAAHCEGSFVNGVYIGCNCLNGTDAVESIGVESEHPHPDYKWDTFEADIMLIKLSSPSSSPVSLCNTRPTVPSVGETVEVIGFGATEEGGPVSDILMKVEVPIVNYDTCEDQYENFYLHPYDGNMICAGFPEGKKDRYVRL